MKDLCWIENSRGEIVCVPADKLADYDPDVENKISKMSREEKMELVREYFQKLRNKDIPKDKNI
ncbi:MAG: hypothetical protein IJG63_06355 [Oscillospiraceae bacterium]|nr:hypothetical protein [Oscillospiraceae bacterium]